MTEKDNLALARRFYEDVWNGEDYGILKKIVAPDVEVGESPSVTNVPEGIAAIESQVRMYNEAFPEGRIEVDEMFASGPWVTVLWTGKGKHTAPLFGIEPTKKRVAVHGTDVLRIEQGRITEFRSEFDGLGMLVQLGLFEPFEL